MAFTSEASTVPLRSIVLRSVGTVFDRIIDGIAARREAKRLRHALLTYRGVDSRVLDDIGLSTAVIEGALAGEERAVRTFLAWRRARRIA